MNKLTVTIGIPAYNEESNIGYLISELLKQKNLSYHLEKILVISDGSTDKTADIVREFKDNRITIIDNKIRQGLAQTQNEILQKSESDVLVLLNADIMILDEMFLRKIVKPIADNESDLVCIELRELEQYTITGDILNVSMKFKNSIFEKYKNGNNIYTCHAIRAFSKKLYKEFMFKGSIGEDAYSYLYATFNNFKYEFIKDTKAYYRLPSNYKDHEKQSIRFIQSKKKFVKDFGEDFVHENYYLPKSLLILTGIKFSMKYPIHMTIYVLIYLGILIKSLFVSKINDRWDISTSSKVLRAKTI